MSEQNQIDPQTPVTLNINVGIVNGILIALGKLPYEQAAGLIDVIRNQAASQLKAPQQPQPTEITGEQQ
jgi:hypothetical protein